MGTVRSAPFPVTVLDTDRAEAVELVGEVAVQVDRLAGEVVPVCGLPSAAESLSRAGGLSGARFAFMASFDAMVSRSNG